MSVCSLVKVAFTNATYKKMTQLFVLSHFLCFFASFYHEQKKFAVRFCPRWMGADIFKAKGRYKVGTGMVKPTNV
jgi:hypothetical protein